MTHRLLRLRGRTALSSTLTLISILLFWGLPKPLRAQVDTGSITGTVTDSSGARVANALVTLRNANTGVAVNTPTTSTGAYFFGDVLIGTYSLKVTQKGFKTFEANGIQIHVQQTDNLDVQLQVGAATEQITVTTSAALLQTQDATLGQTVNGEAVDNLPLNGRDWDALAMISAGVTTTSGGNATGNAFIVNGTDYGQNDFRLDGIDNNEEIYGSNPSVIPPPDAIQEFKLQTGDFSAEFGHSTGGIINATIKSGTNRVRGDLFEYVRNNDLDANDYFSKQQGLPIAGYHQNQFGGTIGGPVFIPKVYNGRDKTFFFFDYQGTRLNTPSTTFDTVPTALQQSSGYTNNSDLITYSNSAQTAPQYDALGRAFPIDTIFDPATTRTVAANSTDPVSGLMNTSSSAAQVRDPFFTGGSVAGITNFMPLESELNQIPASRLDQNAVKLLGLYPTPTSSGISNNYFQSAPAIETINSYDIRIDKTLGAKDAVFGIYSSWHQFSQAPNNLPGLYANGQSWSGPQPYPHYSVSGGYTHTFTPTLLNEFHYGFNHNIDNYSATDASTMGIPAMFGIQGIPQIPGNGGLPTINISALTGFGDPCCYPTYRTIFTNEIMDDVTKIHGNHIFKAGYQLDILSANISQPAYGNGEFTYSGQFTTIPNSGNGGTGIADLLITPGPSTVGGVANVGGLASYYGSNFTYVNDRRFYSGVYFQDDWKVSPKLTLNLGLRWDHYTPYAEINGRQANFLGSNGGDGVGGTYYIPASTCQTPVSPFFTSLLATDGIKIACSGNDTGTSQYTNFAPRAGFAYHVLPRVVVRGGYGIAYGALGNIGFGGTMGTNYPFSFNVTGNAPNSNTPLTFSNGQTATMENTFSVINLASPASANESSIQGIPLFGRQWNYQTPYTETINLTLQFELDHSDALQVGYVGTLGRHLDILGTANAPSAIEPPGANLYSYIPDPDFSPGAKLETTNGASAYNSLQATFTRQLSHGLWVTANQTYSKCFSDQYTQDSALSGYRAQWLPGFGIKGDYALCGSDATNVFHLAGGYQLPLGHGRQFLASTNKATDLVLGGWSLNSILTLQGGQPFGIGCPVSTTAFFGCNADVVPGVNIYASHRSQQQWLNPAAFATPPVATATSATVASLGGEGQQARGPAFKNLDASLFKDFQLHEQTKLQFRVEAFNLSNTPQFGNPGNLDYLNAYEFSEITGLRNNPRLLQLALKLYY